MKSGEQSLWRHNDCSLQLQRTSTIFFYFIKKIAEKMNIAAEHYLKLCWVAQNFRFLKKQVNIHTYTYIMYKAVSRSDGDLIILACMNRANGIEWEHPCLLEKKRECNYEENEEDPVWHVKTSRSLKSYNMGEGRKKQSLSRDEHHRCAWSTHHGGPNRFKMWQVLEV